MLKWVPGMAWMARAWPVVGISGGDGDAAGNL